MDAIRYEEFVGKYETEMIRINREEAR